VRHLPGCPADSPLPLPPHPRRRTEERPDRGALQHLATLAAQSAARLQQLLLGGDGGGGALAGDTEQEAEAALQQLFAGDSSGLDLLIRLRREALPQADRALQLPPAGGKRRRGGADPRDEVSEVLAEAPEPPPKRSRAVLRAFPEHIAASKAQAKLASELLVGFDPVRRYVSLLEARYGHLATFCADFHGGGAVGLRWQPGAFVAQPVRMATAHTMVECSATCALPGVKGLTVPNVVLALGEMLELGQGLVEEVVHVGGGEKLLQ
jgi:hypothetical protein